MSRSRIIEVTPVLTTVQYGATDVLFATTEVPLAIPAGKSARLVSLVLLDKDDKKGDLDIIFLRSNTAIGTVNSVYNGSDAVASEFLTVVPIAEADYTDLINAQIAVREHSHTGMGVVLRPTDKEQQSLWIGGLSKDTDTYSASGLLIKIGLEIS